MPQALFHLRRMRGGAQSHLMYGRDRHYYVVKFVNNPQDVRVLANEMLANLLADFIGLPVPKVELVRVERELVDRTPELCFQTARGDVPCADGLHFGSRLPVDPTREPIYDFVPDQTLERLVNVRDFTGMLMFDQWTCNADARQAVFYKGGETTAPIDSKPARLDGRNDEIRYRALMIDQGFCFNDGEWNFPDSPLRGLYPRLVVYHGVTGWESFEPWLMRLQAMDWNIAVKFAGQIPWKWYAGQDDALDRLMESLEQRRSRMPELLDAVRRSAKSPFPNWKLRVAVN